MREGKKEVSEGRRETKDRKNGGRVVKEGRIEAKERKQHERKE